MQYTLATINALNDPATLAERVPIFSAELARIRPDILSLQEVLHAPGEEGTLDPQLDGMLTEAGLKLAVLARSLTTFHPKLFSTAIAYNPETTTLIETGAIENGSVPYSRFTGGDTAYAVFRTSDDSDRNIIVFSSHLAWGAENGGERLLAANKIEAQAAHLNARFPDALIFLAGDFNEEPTGAAVRYLTGNSDAIPGTYWVDAWAWLHKNEEGITQYPTSKYAAATALRNNIRNPATLPERRIDYIMARGWAYGKLGDHPSVELWGQTENGDASDHLGLVLNFDI